MSTSARTRNIRTGAFVFLGMVLLVWGLYLIGKDENLFSKNYPLRARFDNVQGLSRGNNIRFNGIQVGTVRDVRILSDTVIEVLMMVDEKMRPFIRLHDYVTIGTDGLMGNKLVNINPARDGSRQAADNDLLRTKKAISTDAMLETLNKTNYNLANISEDVNDLVHRFNASRGLWSVLEDTLLAVRMNATLLNLQNGSRDLRSTVQNLNGLITHVRSGKGSMGSLLVEDSFAQSLDTLVTQVQAVAKEADGMVAQWRSMSRDLQSELQTGKGPLPAIVRDSLMTRHLDATLQQVEKGTKSFEENMEALKHNFLFRGYFKRLEKKAQREASKNQ